MSPNTELPGCRRVVSVEPLSTLAKNFKIEEQTCSWKTVIDASCPPAPQSYMHVSCYFCQSHGVVQNKSSAGDEDMECLFRARKIFLVSVAEFSDRARAPFFWSHFLSHFLSTWSQSCAKTQNFRRKKKKLCLRPASAHTLKRTSSMK